MTGWKILATIPLAYAFWAQTPERPDRRIVDTVVAGDGESELNHGYAGHDDSAGTSNGKSFRRARGWMRYAMTAFDDTQVTVACTFAGESREGAEFEVVVEDSLVATKVFPATVEESVVVEVTVPFVVTKGRTNIAVTIRAKNGTTPALRELRIVQDHHEQEQQLHVPLAQLQSLAVPSFPKSQNPIGVAR